MVKKYYSTTIVERGISVAQVSDWSKQRLPAKAGPTENPWSTAGDVDGIFGTTGLLDTGDVAWMVRIG